MKALVAKTRRFNAVNFELDTTPSTYHHHNVPKNHLLLGFRNGHFPDGYLSVLLTTMHYKSVKSKQKYSLKSGIQVLSLPHGQHPKIQKVREMP
jgi:hypothetical protein